MNEVNNTDYIEYAEQFTDEVTIMASENGIELETAMLMLIQESIGESKLINDPQIFCWRHDNFRGTDIEINGYDVDPFDNSLTLFYSDFGKPYHPLYKSEVESKANKALNFAKWSISEHKNKFIKYLENQEYDLYDEIQNLSCSATGISKIKIVYVTNGKSLMRKQDFSKVFQDIDIDYYVWDIDWIYDHCNSYGNLSIIIDFKESPLSNLVKKGLPYLEVPQADEVFSCYQCVVPGTVLANIYRTYGSPLLEGNVRSFLSTITTVNSEIQKTLAFNPDRFYIYNNGIAAIASEVETDSNGHFITKINDIQIINGGQTTASLAYAAEKKHRDLSSVFVPMKITVIHPEKIDQLGQDELVQKISETSNSQNKITKEDFFSNSPIHLKLKKLSNSVSVPGMKHNTYWFYERVRGEYKQSTMFSTYTQKKIFQETHPKEKIVTKRDFSKYFNLLQMKPYLVSKGPSYHVGEFQKFVTEKYNNNEEEYFNESFFKTICGIAMIYRDLEGLMTPKNLSWFKGSYRAPIIYYGLSMFLYLLKTKNHMALNLPMLWERDKVPEALEQELLRICEKAYMAISAADREVENVTQWVKRAECWSTVKSKLDSYKINMDAIIGVLISTNELKARENSIKKDQKLIDDVDTYNKAFKTPYIRHWMELARYCQLHKQEFENLTDSDIRSLTIVALFDSHQGKQVPTRADCKRALEIWTEAEVTGFKPN